MLRDDLPPPPPPPPGMRFEIIGKVISADYKSIIIDGPGEAPTTLPLDPWTQVVILGKNRLADISAGDTIRTTSVIAPDGRHRAITVVIFPNERVLNLGQFPLAWGQTTVLTTAIVRQVTKTDDGLLLKLHHPGGETDIAVAADTPTVYDGTGSMDMLRPGMDIIVRGFKADADGKVSVHQVIVP